MRIPAELPWSVVALTLVLSIAPLALAQQGDAEDEEDDGIIERIIYQYTDVHGVTYLVDDLNRVPLAYRTENHLTKIVHRVRGDEEEEWDRARGPAPPEDTPRPVREKPRDEPEADPTPPGERIAELEARRTELRERLAALEEGSASEESAALAPEDMEQLLADTEAELATIEAELASLR